MTVEQLMDAIRKSLRLAVLDPKAKMGSVRGWDSLRQVQLMLDLEQSFPVEIPGDLYGMLTSIPAIVAFYNERGALEKPADAI